MNDLAEFLEARCVEDEAIVQPVVDGPGVGIDLWEGTEAAQKAQRVFLDHFDEERILRQVKATRALLRRYRAAQTNAASQPDSDFLRGRLSGYEEAMKIAALPYVDHPDYRRKGWKP